MRPKLIAAFILTALIFVCVCGCLSASPCTLARRCTAWRQSDDDTR
jgi:hypothetical protein